MLKLGGCQLRVKCCLIMALFWVLTGCQNITNSLDANGCNHYKNSNVSLKICLIDMDGREYEVKVYGRQNDLIYEGVVKSATGEVRLQDVNQDGIEDILINHFYDVRSNESLHLFLLKTSPKGIAAHYVIHFEEIKNPEFIQPDMISSFVISGSDYLEFYKLRKDGKLCQFDFTSYDSSRNIEFYQNKLKHSKCKGL